MFDLIESVRDLSVLFVGDTIVDEYQYVRPLGKSPKENLIPALALEREVFVGGTHAAANHARSFCKRVEVCCGDMQIRKVRMVDKNYLRKLYEVHYPVPAEPSPAMTDADVTVVTDFGHGFVTRDMITELCDRPFVAVNAQTNGANIGFNLITKYPWAEYVVIDEPEARLAAADNESDLRAVILDLAEGRFDKMVVTRGNGGAIGWDGHQFHEAPAFTGSVVDTMGAGDAFFAVTAPMAKTGAMPDLLRIGNAAGALKTQIVGHRSPVTKDALLGFLRAH